MKVTLIFLLTIQFLFFVPEFILAQTCYQQLSNNNNFQFPTEKFDKINTSACALIDSIPEVYQDSFGIYDFGFYMHDPLFYAGRAAAIDSAISEARSNSKYYLIFIRESSGSIGINNKVWVQLNLPVENIFFCLEPYSDDPDENLRKKLELVVNKNNSQLRLPQNIISAIDTLNATIGKLKDCCSVDPENKIINSCLQCPFSKTDFVELLEQENFQILKGEVYENPNPSKQPNTYTNFFLKQESGNTIDLNYEFNLLIDNYLEFFPSRGTSVAEISYETDCLIWSEVLNDFNLDTSSFKIIFCALSGVNDGYVAVKVVEKSARLIEPNGAGKLYFYNLQGLFLKEAIGFEYHGIFFISESNIPIPQFRFSINQRINLNDILASRSKFYLSDENLEYLREQQERCSENQVEYGGLVYLLNRGKIGFDQCTWCESKEESMPLDDILSIRNYPDYENKNYVSIWHVHPLKVGKPELETQTPSGYTAFLNNPSKTNGDFHAFTGPAIAFDWQNEYLGEAVLPERTWSLPGRIGIIGGKLGVTIFRFVGAQYSPVKFDPANPCPWSPLGDCYKRSTIIGNYEMYYSWILYDLGKKFGIE